MQTFHPRIAEVLSFCAQNIAIATVISIAFSYDVNSELELPYQVSCACWDNSFCPCRSDVLVIVTGLHATLHIIQLRYDPAGSILRSVSPLEVTYRNACVWQYLTLVPVYFIERPVVSMERSSGLLSYGPYIISALLSEVPRAVLQSCLLLGNYVCAALKWHGGAYVIRVRRPSCNLCSRRCCLLHSSLESKYSKLYIRVRVSNGKCKCTHCPTGIESHIPYACCVHLAGGSLRVAVCDLCLLRSVRQHLCDLHHKLLDVRRVSYAFFCDCVAIYCCPHYCISCLSCHSEGHYLEDYSWAFAISRTCFASYTTSRSRQ